MNVSLQWQRKELSLLTRTDLGWYPSWWWPWLALPCLIFLQYTERHHTHAYAQTHISILYPWSVWSSGLSATEETGGEVYDKSSLVSFLSFDLLGTPEIIFIEHEEHVHLFTQRISWTSPSIALSLSFVVKECETQKPRGMSIIV